MEPEFIKLLQTFGSAGLSIFIMYLWNRSILVDRNSWKGLYEASQANVDRVNNLRVEEMKDVVVVVGDSASALKDLKETLTIRTEQIIEATKCKH